MLRIVLICCFASLLASCAAGGYQGVDWGQARLACADVGIDPGTSAFDNCVFNLYYTLWDLQNAGER